MCDSKGKKDFEKLSKKVSTTTTTAPSFPLTFPYTHHASTNGYIQRDSPISLLLLLSLCLSELATEFPSPSRLTAHFKVFFTQSSTSTHLRSIVRCSLLPVKILSSDQVFRMDGDSSDSSSDDEIIVLTKFTKEKPKKKKSLIGARCWK